MASSSPSYWRTRNGRAGTAAAFVVGTLAIAAFPAAALAGSDSTVPPDDSTSSTAAATTTVVDTTPGTDEPTTTAAASSTAAATTTTAAAATASSSDFTSMLATECEGDAGQQLLASGLQVVMGEDGSLRIVELVLTCDIVFEGEIDTELGRPLTNVEAIIADPVNNITPNQAQTELLNEELAIYWRIADAWAQSSSGSAATPTTTTAAAESSAPAGDVATSEAEAPATTGA